MAPVAPLAPDRERIQNRDVALLLALALAEGSRELAAMQRTAARLMTEGEIAVLVALIRAEPKVAELLEDTRILKSLVSSGISIGTSTVGTVNSVGRIEKVHACTATVEAKLMAGAPKLDLSGRLASLAAKPAVARRLGRFTAVKDALVMNSPEARYLFARNAAEAELRGRSASQEEVLEEDLEERTAEHEQRLLSEAKARNEIDPGDWHDGRAVPTTTRTMLRDVFGDEPTARQEAKLQDAIQILREGPGLGKKWRLSSRDELADRLESFRPFGRLSGKSFDNPDGRALISAIREGRVDLSVALADKEGRIRQPSGGVGVRDVAGTVVQQLDRAWDDGWAKDEKEIPEALQNISQTDREILDAWYALLMEGRLESIRWSSRFADIFCDVADVAMGRSEEDS